MEQEIKLETRNDCVFIATPMYGGQCTGPYTLGLLRTCMALAHMNVAAMVAFVANESLITRARNTLVQQFLRSDATHLLFIDADIGFEPEAVVALLEADEDVVCGLYPKKEINWGRIHQVAQGGGRTDLHDFAGAYVLNALHDGEVTPDDKGLIEVRHGGTGFMLIRREVFNRLAPYVPSYRTSTERNPDTGKYVKPLTYEFFATSIDDSGALLSEDYHFCELFRRHGGKIYANPFINLQHVGTYVFSGDIMKSGGNQT